MLLSDNFALDSVGTLPAGWSIAGAVPARQSWKVGSYGGGHDLVKGGWSGALTATSIANVSNVAVVAQVKPNGWSDPGDCSSACEGVVARYQDADDYLTLQFVGTKTVEIAAVSGGQQTVLASVPYSVASGAWYSMSLTAVGSSLIGSVNGLPLLAATAPSAFASGGIGLQATAKASFANVIATAI